MARVAFYGSDKQLQRARRPEPAVPPEARRQGTASSSDVVPRYRLQYERMPTPQITSYRSAAHGQAIIHLPVGSTRNGRSRSLANTRRHHALRPPWILVHQYAESSLDVRTALLGQSCLGPHSAISDAKLRLPPRYCAGPSMRSVTDAAEQGAHILLYGPLGVG